MDCSTSHMNRVAAYGKRRRGLCEKTVQYRQEKNAQSFGFIYHAQYFDFWI